MFSAPPRLSLCLARSGIPDSGSGIPDSSPAAVSLFRLVGTAANAADRLAGLVVFDPDLHAVGKRSALDDVRAAGFADEPQVGDRRGPRSAIPRAHGVLAGLHVHR